MRTPEMILKDLVSLEKEIREVTDTLNALDDKDLEIEPEHRKMISELMNSDFIARLPNQAQRDDALENYVLNNEQYRPLHYNYLKHKNTLKNTYRLYYFLQDCMKNRRAELQVITFGGRGE